MLTQCYTHIECPSPMVAVDTDWTHWTNLSPFVSSLSFHRASASGCVFFLQHFITTCDECNEEAVSHSTRLVPVKSLIVACLSMRQLRNDGETKASDGLKKRKGKALQREHGVKSNPITKTRKPN